MKQLEFSDLSIKTGGFVSKATKNIAAVVQRVEEQPDLSDPCRSLKLGIPQTSWHRILQKDWDLRAYKFQLINVNF